MSAQTLKIRLPWVSVLVSVERLHRLPQQEHPPVLDAEERGEHRAAYRHPDAVLEAHVGMPMRR